MPRLHWSLYQNPIYVSDSPLYLDLSEHYQLTQAQFSTYHIGGFGNGTLSIANPSVDDVRRAADEFLMKRVVATDGSGRIAYEGFVAEVDAVSGTHRYHRTMDGFANRLFAEYRYAGKHVTPIRARCPRGAICKGRIQVNEGDVSTGTTQADLGIKEEWVDVRPNGILTPAIATVEGQSLIKEKLNSRAIDFNLDPNGEPQFSISLTLWGYWATLQFRKQTIYAKTNTEIKTIITNALTVGAKAQFLNTTDFSQMITTGTSVKFNTGSKPLWLQEYIQNLIANGDSSGKRLFFQIWENRRCFLITRPVVPRYQSINNEWRVFVRGRDAGSGDGYGVIPPHMVRAGGYIVAANADPSVDDYADVINRRYSSLIETTTYDDIAESLHIPAASEIEMSPERLLAAARKQLRSRVT